MSFGDTLTLEVFDSMKSDAKYLFVVQLFPSDGKFNVRRDLISRLLGVWFPSI
jgi:hypothetical protein